MHFPIGVIRPRIALMQRRITAIHGCISAISLSDESTVRRHRMGAIALKTDQISQQLTRYRASRFTRSRTAAAATPPPAKPPETPPQQPPGKHSA